MSVQHLKSKHSLKSSFYKHQKNTHPPIGSPNITKIFHSQYTLVSQLYTTPTTHKPPSTLLIGRLHYARVTLLIGGRTQPHFFTCSPREPQKKQRHFITADLSEATSQAMLSEKQRHFVTGVSFQGMCPKNSAILLRPICWKQPHKQCCPRNSTILLRSFLSRACAQKTAPFCYGRFVGSNLTSNAVIFITS